MSEPFIPEELELWVINKNAKYRIRKQEITENIQLTFWVPNEPVKHYNTTYENLIKLLDSGDKSLYSPIPS